MKYIWGFDFLLMLFQKFEFVSKGKENGSKSLWLLSLNLEIVFCEAA